MGIFRSRTQVDLATVRGRLNAAEKALPIAEQRVADLALAASIGDDEAAARDYTKASAELQERKAEIDRLRLAVAEAERLEQARLADLQLRANASKLRAFRQHLGALEKAAGEFQRAAEALAGASVKMYDAATKARALVPPTQAADHFRCLFEGPLERIGERELARVGRVEDYFKPRPSMPGAHVAAIPGGTVPSTLQPISKEIAEITKLYAKRFADFLSLPTSIPAKPEPSEAEPSIGKLAQAESAASGDEDAQMSETGGNPHPEGSEEHAGYAAALAHIRAQRSSVMETSDA